MSLAGQGVLITGAAQGLGAAIARAFAAEGARLVLMDRNEAALREVAADCHGALALPVDLSDASAAETAIAAALASVPDITTLIHNAAILQPKPFGQMTLSDFRLTVDVGLQAGFQLARALWPAMASAGQGTLVFVSSRSGIEGFADETAYCAAKHGLEGLSKSLALEGAPLGIASMTVTPGMYMKTPMSERNYTDEGKAKWVDPELLAPAFLMMARDGMRFSGQRLNAWELAAS
jgi:3-hydroxybutyrate dehydrogenase